MKELRPQIVCREKKTMRHFRATARLNESRRRTFFTARDLLPAPPASSASTRCAAAPLSPSLSLCLSPSLSLSLSLSLIQFSKRTSPCQTPSSHTHTHRHRHTRTHTHPHQSADSSSTDQTTMPARDAASLLVGLLVLFHTWGGECPEKTLRRCSVRATRGFARLLAGFRCF